MTRYEWSFHYAGPREAAKDMRCTTCRAAETGECPTHAKMFADGCAHCGSAKGAPCQAHWGLKAAIEGHAVNVDEDAKKDYAMASALILAEPQGKKKNVDVTIRGDGDLAATDHRELFIEIKAY